MSSHTPFPPPYSEETALAPHLGTPMLRPGTPETSESESEQPPSKKMKEDGEISDESSGAGGEIPQGKFKLLEPGEHVVERLPKELKFPQDPHSLQLYPAKLDGIYNYRQRSTLSHAETKVPEGPQITKPSFVALTFFETLPFWGETREYHIGGLRTVDNVDKRCVELSWILHSQVPGFIFTIHRGDNVPKVKVTFHANSLYRAHSEDDPNTRRVAFSMDTTHELQNLDHPDLVPIYGDNGCLINITFGVHQIPVSPPSYGPRFARPRVDGISDADYATLCKLASSAKDFGDPDSPLSLGDWALIGLLQFPEIRILKSWISTPAALKIFNNLKNFMSAAMHDCGTNGNFPHYRRQAAQLEPPDMDLLDQKLDVSQFMPPRDLVKLWNVSVNNEGQASRAIAAYWLPFPNIRYPDLATKGFAVRLAIERERYFKQGVLQAQLEKRSGPLRASISPFPRTPGLYWIDIAGKETISIFESASAFKETRPDLHSRMTLTIADEGPYNGVNFSAVVEENAFGRAFELFVVARPKEESKQKFKLSHMDNPITVSITVKLDGDATGSNRQIAAVLELCKPLNRKAGVDVPSVVLDTPGTIAEDRTNSLWKEIEGKPNAHAEFWKIIDQHGLSELQRTAAKATCESMSGFTLIDGKPETGRTFTLMVIVIAHVLVGRIIGHRRPILCTAPSNAAVDNMLRTMIRILDKLPNNNVRLMRFKGAHTYGTIVPKDGQERGPLASAIQQIQDAAEKSVDSEAGESTVNQVWRYVEHYKGQINDDGDIVDYYFSQVCRKFIETIEQDPNHQYSSQAADWHKQRRRDLRPQNFTSEEVQAARKHMVEVENFWNELVFEDTDVIFATNTPAAHQLPMAYFRPSILVSDDVHATSVPEQIISMAAYKESVQLVVLAGDHTEKGPPSFAKGTSETGMELADSVFKKLYDRSNARVEKVTLALQPPVEASTSETGGESKKRKRRKHRLGLGWVPEED